MRGQPWLLWPSYGLAAVGSWHAEPLLQLAQLGGAITGPAALLHCRPTPHRDAAVVGAVALPSCPCLPLHLYATAIPVRCHLCRTHVAGLAIALSLMALRCVGHAYREHACLSASA